VSNDSGGEDGGSWRAAVCPGYVFVSVLGFDAGGPDSSGDADDEAVGLAVGEAGAHCWV